MSRNYKFHNPEGTYFVSFAVVNWLYIFAKDEYKNIIIDSLNFCQQEKGMDIFAWCIMPNHIHLVFRSVHSKKPGLLLGDMKRFTSKAIVNAIVENPDESEKDILISQFEKAASKSSNVEKYQFWQHDNQPIEIWSNKFICQKINYIHYNPVEAGLVSRPEEYKYSSAKDYNDEKGLVNNIIVLRW